MLKKVFCVCGGLLVITVISLSTHRFYITRTGTTAINQTLSTLAPLTTITYQRIRVSLFSRRISLANIIIKPAGNSRAITIDQMLLENLDTRNLIPRHLNLEARGIIIPSLETLGAYGPVVQALGYQQLTGNLSLSYTYNQSRNVLVVKKLVAHVQATGEMSLAGTLSGVKESDIEALITRKAAAGCRQWLINQGHLAYRDDSLIKRFLSYQAKSIGETLPQLRYGMTSDLAEAIKTEKDAFTRTSLQQFGAFITNLKYLEITAQPDNPVSYTTLKKIYDQEGIKGMIPSLKLTFSTHQP